MKQRLLERFRYPGANATSTTVSHTVRTMNNGLILVQKYARNNGTLTAPTFNGSSLTLVPGSQVSAGSGTSRREVAWYYALSPTATTADFVMQVGSADSGNYGGIVYHIPNVNQTTPFRSQGGGNYALTDSGTAVTTTSLTPASSAGDLVLSALYSGSAPTAGSGMYKEAGGGVSQRAWSLSKEGEAGTTTMSATMSSNTVVHSALAIIFDDTTQPLPADYGGSRGKKSWVVSANISGESLSAGSTLYCALSPTVESGGTASLNRTIMREACTISAPATRLSANAASGSSTYTLQVNGVDSSVAITISAGATGYITGTGTASIASGDEVGWKLVTGSGGAVTLTHLLCVIEATAANTITLLGAHSSSAGKLTPGETRYLSPYGSRASTTTNTDERKAFIAALLNCAYGGLLITKAGTTTNGQVDAVSRVNDATGNQALTWSSGSTSSQEDTTHTDTLVDGDQIAIRMVSAGASGDFEYERIAGRLVNTVGEFMVMSASMPGNGINIGAAGTQYVSLGGELGISSTEGPTQITAPFDHAIKRLFIVAGESTSVASTSNTAVLRVNGVDTALVVTFWPLSEQYLAADLDHVVNVSAGDQISISVTHGTGGGNNTQRIRAAGYVGVERAASGLVGPLIGGRLLRGALTSGRIMQ